MAKAKAKAGAETATAEDATTGEGTAQTEAEDPKVAEAVADHADALANLNELRKATAEAEEAETAARSALEALTAPPAPPAITGPRIKLEHTGEVVAVPAGDERERRLLLNGHNFEHVSDAVDQDEVIWVYRRM